MKRAIGITLLILVTGVGCQVYETGKAISVDIEKGVAPAALQLGKAVIPASAEFASANIKAKPEKRKAYDEVRDDFQERIDPLMSEMEPLIDTTDSAVLGSVSGQLYRKLRPK